MIQKAAEFAEKAHEGKFRKGTSVPYIVHPLETAAIVSGMTGDEEVICAALLHDVIEDAGVTYEELEKQFGARVAGLVQAESEDKTKSWQERKQTTVLHMETASVEVKMICLGDKLSNLRSTAADLLLKGESVWEKFREKDKRKHEWYYRSIYARLSGLGKETAYAEYGMLLQKIFGQ
jgi:GTP diphosphokinase / guanosine-3',5'-bis(diphosphate) 3'-diphosphatase